MSESPEFVRGCLVQEYERLHTGIDDGHGGAAEELTTSGTKLNLWWNQVSRKPSEVTRDLFSGPALKYRSVSCR